MILSDGFSIAIIASILTSIGHYLYHNLKSKPKQPTSIKVTNPAEIDLKKKMAVDLNVYSKNLLTKEQHRAVDKAVTELFQNEYKIKLGSREKEVHLYKKYINYTYESEWPLVRRGIALKLREYGFPAKEFENGISIDVKAIKKVLKDFEYHSMEKEPVPPHSEGVYR